MTDRRSIDSATARDAARYAYFRELHWSSADLCAVVRPKESINLGAFCPSREQLDAEIDKGMQAAGIVLPGEAVNAETGNVDGAPYGIIDPDYARVFTQARIVAWQYGYACVMHGSFTRDLDLLLVPWTEEAKDNYDQMLKLIAAASGLRFRDGQAEVYNSKVDWTEKPHGRKACSLHFPAFGDRRWVDISVMPVKTIHPTTID